MTILDLDDLATWDNNYNKFIKNDPYWSVIVNAISSESNDEFNKIKQGLENSIEYVDSSELLSLRQRCSTYFKGIYTHVVAYHACRPTNIESYLKEGIIPTNTEKLIEKAKSFFNDEYAVSKAVEDIGTEYLNHGSDTIGFFISQTGSLESSCSHYLKYGSELFQCIANRLGEWAVQRLSNQGTPTLLQCSLPISWLNDFTTFPMEHCYALAPLKQLIIRLHRQEERDNSIRGAFLLKRSVPEKLILSTIDMTPFIIDEKNPNNSVQ